MPTSHDSGVGIDPAFLALPLSKLCLDRTAARP